jgi:type VI secretion system protein ImpL
MKKLKIKRILGGVGLLGLFGLILKGGPYIGLRTLNTRLMVILIILAIGIIILLFKQMQANKGAAQIERSIKSQAEEQKLGIRPDKRREIDELKHELTSAIESLKKSKLGKGISGRAALYALPWYMFIGPPAAGKTTAIVNSGLEYPYGMDIKGVGGTRNCDWFFSNSAILLDTAGRYMTEEEDKEEWNAFLEVLKKHRRRKPINGVIVGISITDIFNVKTEEIEWHAKNIRRRIDDLIARLGVRLPVYLVFTKCDLLQGFVELFENLSRKEREQIWGCTLSGEHQKSLNPREIFDGEIDVLIQSLNDFRLKRLSNPTKPENRSKIYVFPLEFASIREYVGYFIGTLFQPNPYQESPLFRGFYFTSGTQEGTPIDRVIHSIAKHFDLPPEVISEPEVEKKSYFIKKLFTDVIVPDQNIVSPTSKTSKLRKWVHFGIITAAVVFLAAFVLGISLSYIRGQNNLAAVEGAAELMKKVDWDRNGYTSSDIKNIDRFREQLSELERRRENPPLIRIGMYRGNDLLPEGLKLYYRKFNLFVDSYLYKELERRLKYKSQYYWNKLESYLRAYLLMGSEIVRLDEANKQFLIDELIPILDESYFPFIRDEGNELQPMIEAQVEFFLRHLGDEGIPAFKNDMNLIGSIRSLILENRKPSLDRIYDVLKRQAEEQLFQLQVRSVTLSDILSDNDDDIFYSEYEVPALFTKAGWENYIREAIESESQKTDEEDWVLGIRKQDLIAERNPEEITAKLQSIYFEEYEETWWQFLESIEYKPVDDISLCLTLLENLGDPDDSPLKVLLEGITEQTRFGEDSEPEKKSFLKKMEDTVTKVATKKTPSSQDQKSIHPLDEKFSSIHVLCFDDPESGEASKVLNDILSQYKNVHSMLESVVDDESGSEAIDLASKVLKEESGDLPEALDTIRTSITDLELESLISLFDQPVRNAWVTILSIVQDHLNNSWQNDVVDPFTKRLANYYPFNKQGQDASIDEVKDFFMPENGILWKFIEEELGPFVEVESWDPNEWDGHGIQLSPDAIVVLMQADRIKDQFFSQQEFAMKFSLKPLMYTKVIDGAPIIEQITLRIDGENYPYRMGGTRWKDFSWPGTEGLAGASLSILPSEANFDAKTFGGPWGWLKLLGTAEIEPNPSSDLEFKVSWRFSQKGSAQVAVIIHYDLKASSVFSPFHDIANSFKFDCPNTLN